MKVGNKKVEEILQDLEDGVISVFQSDAYRDFLNLVSKLYPYSTNNCILIMQQRPSASAVASFSGWKKLNRNVKKGEKAIRIIAPIIRKTVDDEPGTKDASDTSEKKKLAGFRIASVFDISQTEGEEIPMLIKELQGTIDEYERLIEILTDIAPVPVRYGDMEGNEKGYYSVTDKEIVLRDGMSQLQTVKTLLHEIAHAELHAENTEKSRQTKEVEAESIAFAVSAHLGLDTGDYSFGYIATWSGKRNVQELKASLDTIRETVYSMIGKIEGRLSDDTDL